jgi:hypothetical protein
VASHSFPRFKNELHGICYERGDRFWCNSGAEAIQRCIRDRVRNAVGLPLSRCECGKSDVLGCATSQELEYFSMSSESPL